MLVPFVPVLIALLAVGLVLLVAVGLRVRVAVRRFDLVRGAFDSHVAERTGLLKARSAALGVAVTDLRPPRIGHRSVRSAPRTIDGSVEREDHRA